MGAGASAYMMAMKGDYTTLIGASEEVKSERSIELWNIIIINIFNG